MVQLKFNLSVSKERNVKVNVSCNKIRSNANIPYGDFAKFANIIGVYYIKCKITNKQYVGSSKNIQSRLSKHFSELFNNKHRNKKLQEEFNKYGYDNFEFDIYETCDIDELLNKERNKQISIGVDNLYNEKISNYYISEELKKIHASADKSSHKTNEYREKMRELKSNYIIQYEIDYTNKTYNAIAMYDNMKEVIDLNPTFKPQPIRGVCNGSKKSAYGFYWRYADENGNILKCGYKQTK